MYTKNVCAAIAIAIATAGYIYIDCKPGHWQIIIT